MIGPCAIEVILEGHLALSAEGTQTSAPYKKSANKNWSGKQQWLHDYVAAMLEIFPGQ